MVVCVSLDQVPLPPEVQVFFREIKERPDDDTPRLVFADWLQEYGDPAAAARGEFLRLSVLRHRLSPDDPRYELFKRRQGELFRSHGWAWLGPFTDAARAWTFERGMIQITVLPDNLQASEVSDWAQTAAAFWIDSLQVRAILYDYAHPGENDISPLVRTSLLSHLIRLDLSDHSDPLGFHLLFVALRAGRVPFLRQLLLVRTQLTPKHLFTLAHCPPLSRLTLLDLRDSSLADSDARILADSPYLRNGTVLRLERNRFTNGGMALLRRAFGDRARV